MHFLDLRSGGRMPALGFGTWQLQGKTCVDATITAVETGYRHIDTAQIYENEAEVGQALSASGVKRGELFVTTKLWTTNFTAARVAASMQESLDKLRMDYVDLLLIHWPNPAVPLEETLAAMNALVRQGRARAIGISNFPVALMREAAAKSEAPIACNQVEYHAMLSQKKVLDHARSEGIAVTAYSPLGRGKLSKHPVLEKISRKYGKSAGQVALRWLIQQPGVAAIPKAASEENARRNFEIFDFALDAQDNADIAGLSGNNRLVDPAWSPQWDAA